MADSENVSTTEYPDQEELDPRVQDELEKLNKASDDINKLELELDEARASFRQVLTESTQRLNALAKKLGSCIEKARPYYEARMRAKEAQIETQNAALRFERACSQQAAAKEMVYLAEQGFFNKGQPFDPAWQEMLNHATMKVNEAERERLESEVAHQVTARIFSDREQRVKELQKQLKRNIAKSRPYFEMKAKFNQHMEDQKRLVSHLERAVIDAKRRYAEALHSLEMISDEIHEQRRESKLRLEMGSRGAGVGAETPEPPPLQESSEASDTADSPHSENTDISRCISNPQDIPKFMMDKSTARYFQSGQSPGSGPLSCSLPLRSSPIGERMQQSMPRSASADISQAKRDSPKHPRPTSISSSIQSINHPLAQTAVPTLHDLNDKTTTDVPKPHNNAEKTNKDMENVEIREKANGREEGTSSETPDVVLSNSASNSDIAADGLTPKSEASSPPTNVTSPETESEADPESQKMNAEIMATLQKAKVLKSPFLHPNRSREDLLDEMSDSESITGSLASLSVLDDEQIESLMMETGEYITFLAKQAEENVCGSPSKRTLPAKLSYLDNYVTFEHEYVDSMKKEDTAIVQESSELSNPNQFVFPTMGESMPLSCKANGEQNNDNKKGDVQNAPVNPVTFMDHSSLFKKMPKRIHPLGQTTESSKETAANHSQPSGAVHAGSSAVSMDEGNISLPEQFSGEQSQNDVVTQNSSGDVCKPCPRSNNESASSHNGLAASHQNNTSSMSTRL